MRDNKSEIVKRHRKGKYNNNNNKKTNELTYNSK